MSKKIFLMLFSLMAILIVVQIFHVVKREARPPVMSPAVLKKIEIGQIPDDFEVVVTIDNNRYHLPGCKEIYGVTEKIEFRAARSKGVHPCPYCISKGSD